MMQVAIGSWSPNESLAERLGDLSASGHYPYAEDRQRIVQSMAVNYDFIIAQAVRGVPSKLIAAGHGVSREAIDKRLRPLGLKNPPGVRGRPKSSPQAASR
jgi:hypothetical protein